jgi:enoyl-CoA hydratase
MTNARTSTAPETIIYRKAGPIAEIRFNRPHRLNAVVEPLYRELLWALGDAETDGSVRVVLLTGEGRAFCVGADLKEHQKGERTPFDQRAYLMLGNRVCERIYRLGKPVIAAVNGYALGAGAEMAISADFLIMTEEAEIGFPEVSIGTFIGGGTSHILPRLVGLAKARELVFTGARIDGHQAHAIGLAARVFSGEAFTDGVMQFAQALASKAPFSMALAKEHLNGGGSRTYDAALLTELEGVRACMTTEDWREGVIAFAERRAPVFKGR